MSAPLALFVCVTAAVLLAAHAEFQVCVEETEGNLIGVFDVLHYELLPYQNILDVVLPQQRPGVIQRGVHVLACGTNAPTIQLNGNNLVVIRGDELLRMEINVTVKRYFTLFSAPTDAASSTSAQE